MSSTSGSVPNPRVTLWTSTCYEKDGNSNAKSELQYYFSSNVYYSGTAVDIEDNLTASLDAAQQAQAPWIVISSIEGYPIWLPSSLSVVIPMLQPALQEDFLNTSRWERGTVALPIVRKDPNSESKYMTFFMQYPTLQTNRELPTTAASSDKIEFCPVATWVGFSTTTPSIPIIVISCPDHRVVKILQDQCVSGNWELDRLSTSPSYIFADLFTALAQWSGVWGSARRDLALRDEQLHGESTKKKKLSVLEQTRALHRDTANVIAMREELRLHITAFQKFKSLIKDDGRDVGLFGKQEQVRELKEQVDECYQNLVHHQESSEVIHKQLENLLSLAFNTETVAQGQAVARLNTLAFAFLPLSWVATLFGMTNFSIPSVWYPLWAFVVVLLLFVGTFAPRAFAAWRTKSQRSRPPSSSNNSQQTNDSTEKLKNDKPPESPDPSQPLPSQPSSNPSPSLQPPPQAPHIPQDSTPASTPTAARPKETFLSRVNPYSRRKKLAPAEQAYQMNPNHNVNPAYPPLPEYPSLPRAFPSDYSVPKPDMGHLSVGPIGSAPSLYVQPHKPQQQYGEMPMYAPLYPTLPYNPVPQQQPPIQAEPVYTLDSEGPGPVTGRRNTLEVPSRVYGRGKGKGKEKEVIP